MSDTVVTILVAAGLGAVAFLLLRSTGGPPGVVLPPKVQPDSCKSVGSAYGVPLCTSAIKPLLSDIPIVSDVLGLSSNGVNIEGCPYLTGHNDWRGVPAPSNKSELDQCIAWAKSPQRIAERAALTQKLVAATRRY